MSGNAHKPIKQAVTTSFEMSLHIANIPGPKILVVSHERSGTHFLMNSIAVNFQYVSVPWINMDYELGINFNAPVAIQGFLQIFEKHNVRNTFKSHHEVGFYTPILDYLLDHFHVLYVYRDVYSTMISFQRFLNGLAWNEGPKRDKPSEFLRTPPSGAMTRYQQSYAANMVERWRNHVDGWLDVVESDTTGRLLAIDYDDLDTNYAETMRGIASFLGVGNLTALHRPSRDVAVVSPSGMAMTAEDDRHLLTEADDEFINQHASATMQRMWIRKQQRSHAKPSELTTR